MNNITLIPKNARCVYVLAHGAGAGMTHPFLETIAQALASLGIGTFRYEFEYMEMKSGRPDKPAVATARVRAAVEQAAKAGPGLPLIAGGKSFGGRMTSQAQAQEALPGVRGLAFLGFPLHPPGKPGTERADHLADVAVPMLFLQGTRDSFAKPEHLQPVIQRLGTRATLHLVEGGDHSFKVPKSAGKAPSAVVNELAGALSGWVRECAIA